MRRPSVDSSKRTTSGARDRPREGGHEERRVRWGSTPPIVTKRRAVVAMARLVQRRGEEVQSETKGWVLRIEGSNA